MSNWSLKDDILPFLQSFGIISAFVITFWTTLRSNAARRVNNYLTLVSNHRAIWSLTFTNKDLLRAVSKDPAIAHETLVPEERRFINMLFLHLSAAYEITSAGEATRIEAMRRDVKSLCEAPHIACYWRESRKYYNRNFVHFIDNCIYSRPNESRSYRERIRSALLELRRH